MRVVLDTNIIVSGLLWHDPDDDAVLACAVASAAERIVSGDPHLLALRQYAGIPIWTAAQLLKELQKAPGS